MIMITPALLLLTVATVLVDCSPQRNVQSILDQLLQSLTTSRPDFQESPQLFSTQNQAMPVTSGTTDQPNEPSAASTGNPLPTTLRPRDNSYRIIYTILNPNCTCQFLNRYNPVCGTDGQTYANLDILNCNKECGLDVEVYSAGACPRSG